jgi:hypothetical protein
MNMTYAIERKIHSLKEEQNETHKRYLKGVSRIKNEFCGMSNTSQSPALLNLERRGA